MAFTADDRFRLVTAPEKAPGCCGICRSSNRGPFVDTGVNDPWNGNVLYICVGCLHDIVDNLESFVRVEVKVVTETADEAYDRAKAEVARAVKDSLNVVLDGFASDSVDSGPVTSDLHDSSVSGVPEDHDGEQGDSTSAPEAAGQDDGPPERKGRNGVSGDSGSKPAGDPFSFAV